MRFSFSLTRGMVVYYHWELLGIVYHSRTDWRYFSETVTAEDLADARQIVLERLGQGASVQRCVCKALDIDITF
jgi:hypothetical protein